MKSNRLALPVGCCAAAALALAAALPGAAQTPIATDRPGFGDGAAVVAPGRLQGEAGYAYTDLGERGQHALGQVWLRLGVVRRVELRVGLNSYVFRERGCAPGPACAQDARYDNGVEDLVLGAKVNLVQGNDAARPMVTAIVGVGLPTGSEAFTADEVQPTLKLALDVPLFDAVGFSGNAGYTFTLGDDGVDLFFVYASLGTGLPGVDGLGVFAGIYTVLPGSGDIGNGLDGGLVYLLDSATQFDLNAGVGLTQDEPDFFVGAGIARRF